MEGCHPLQAGRIYLTRANYPYRVLPRVDVDTIHDGVRPVVVGAWLRGDLERGGERLGVLPVETSVMGG